MPVAGLFVASAAMSAVGAVASASASRRVARAQEHGANVQAEIARGDQEIAREQLGLSERQVAIEEQQYADSRAMQERFAPFYEAMIQQDLDQSRANVGRASEQWAQYEQFFAPTERRMVEEANEYDSPGEIAAARGRAVGDVDAQFDNARRTQAERLSAAGVTSASGRGLALASANDQALARSIVANKATDDIRLRGMSMRENVVKIGRGLPSTGLAADTAAIAAGTAGGNLAQQQLGMVNQSAGVSSNILGAASSALGGATSALGGASSAMRNYSNAWNASGQWRQDQWSQIGNLAGMAASYFGMSDPAAKTDIKAVDPRAVRARAVRLAMRDYRYRRDSGVDDGKRRVGPMADDWAEKFGGDGHVIPMPQAFGVVLATEIANAADIAELQREVRRMKVRH